MKTIFDFGVWEQVRDGNREAAEIFKRHYSYRHYRDGRRDDPNYRNRNQIVGPGEKMVLLTLKRDALFVWRKFIDRSGQTGVNCAVFRKEGVGKASTMIREAERWAHERWGRIRAYTYIDPSKLPGDVPGYCFRRAGWKSAGMTKNGKLILAKELR